MELEQLTADTTTELGESYFARAALSNTTILLELFIQHVHLNPFIKDDLYLKLRADEVGKYLTELHSALARDVK
tara:strand:+ start:1299 stop:1520 length:222 start_codon:yes stop_codon:yes gene_type:complete